MLTILPALLAAASAVAAPCAMGIWDLKASDQTIFRFQVSPTPTGMTATWERPRRFETDGESFLRVSSTSAISSARSVKLADDGVELSFGDPAPDAMPDVFRMRCIDADHVTATYEGSGLAPFDLVRAQMPGSPLGPWQADRTYVRSITRPTNAEMTAIFGADQADRQVEHINWAVVGPADEKRRVRTQALLDAGALQSGDDFFHAAFVFQHGAVPNDFLKAHLLAVIAISRGRPDATWIASATLDRYLQAIGQPQVLGTQFVEKGNSVTQEPYDRALVSDVVRQALHVRTPSEEDQLRQQAAAKASQPERH